MTFQPELDITNTTSTPNSIPALPPSRVRIIATGPGLFDVEVDVTDEKGASTPVHYSSISASLSGSNILSCTLSSRKLSTTIVSQPPPPNSTSSQPSAERLHIFHDGKKITLTIPVPKWIESLGGEVLGAASRKGIRAPMPSVVVEVKVKPGDRVKKGQAVVVLESMKTESVMRSERDGIIVSVGCKNGEMVEEGRELVEIGDA